MFIKHGDSDGKIISIIEPEDVDREKQKIANSDEDNKEKTVKK